MGVGAGLYVYDVVVKNTRSLSHLQISWWILVSSVATISWISCWTRRVTYFCSNQSLIPVDH